MKGIHYVTDENDKKIAVQIDLEEHGELWEDIEDYVIAMARKDEEMYDWEEVKEELKEEGKL